MNRIKKIILLTALVLSSQITTTQIDNKKLAFGVCAIAACLGVGAKLAYNYFTHPATIAKAAQTGSLWKLRAGIFLGASINKNVNLEDPIRAKTPLMYAAEHNQIDSLKLLLKKGSTVDTQGNCGQTALYEAVGNNNITCAQILLSCGASANASYGVYPGDQYHSTAVSLAADNPPMFKLLLDHNAAIDHEVIERVVRNRNKESFTVMLEAIKNNDNHLAQTLLEIYKSRHNQREEYFSLILNNLNDKKDVLNYALYALCSRLNLPIAWANLLIEKGADVNAPHKTRNAKCDTPLQKAVCNHNLPLVKVLLGKGAQVNTLGQTSLLNGLRAGDFQHGDASIAIALLEAGIDLNCQDDDGKTALIQLARFNTGGDTRYKMIKLLLFLGADHTLRARTFMRDRDDQRKTAEQYLQFGDDRVTFQQRPRAEDPAVTKHAKCLQCVRDPININKYLTEAEKEEFSEILARRIQSLKSYERNSKTIRENLAVNDLTGSASSIPLLIIAEYLGAELIK